MNRYGFLRRMAFAALASALFDRWVPDLRWEPEPIAAPFNHRAEFEKQLKYHEAKLWRDFCDATYDQFYGSVG